MKPKYSASIGLSGSTFVDIYFAQPLSPETTKLIKELERFNGIKIKNQPSAIGFWITFPPIWDKDEIVQEVVNILVLEGFDRTSILVK